MYRKLFKYVFVLIIFLVGFSSSAQCAMCRAVLESEEGGTKAEAINDGIVYLMIFPYVMVAIVFYVVYRMKFKKKPPEDV
jgi:hypothetical protein